MLRPLFRYSVTRDAYVLRIVGRRRGPVLTPAAPESPPALAPGEDERT